MRRMKTDSSYHSCFIFIFFLSEVVITVYICHSFSQNNVNKTTDCRFKKLSNWKLTFQFRLLIWKWCVESRSYFRGECIRTHEDQEQLTKDRMMWFEDPPPNQVMLLGRMHLRAYIPFTPFILFTNHLTASWYIRHVLLRCFLSLLLP